MDVLERQSLSEVKIGRGSPICERMHKKIVEYFNLLTIAPHIGNHSWKWQINLKW